MGSQLIKLLSIINKLNEKFKTIKVVSLKGSRALARQIGIRNVKTKWFMFVDSDIILSKNWFKTAEKQVLILMLYLELKTNGSYDYRVLWPITVLVFVGVLMTL